MRLALALSLAMLSIIAVALVQLRPKNHNVGKYLQEDTYDEYQRPDHPRLVEADYSSEASGESNDDKNPSTDGQQKWTLSQKIAVWAVAASIAQFLALIATLALIRHHGHRHLRAYVLVERMGVGDAGGNIPAAIVFIKNYGQTPAYRVRSWAQVAVILAQAEDMGLNIPNQVEEHFPITLGPQAAFNKTIPFDRAITPAEIAEIGTGVRCIYVYGRIEYRDAFKKAHFTNFRIQYSGQYPPPEGAIIHFSEKGNVSD